MTNEEIANRIPVLEGLAVQYESDFTLGEITEEKYHELNQELVDEIEILTEMAAENNLRSMFDRMMGNPLKALGELFK